MITGKARRTEHGHLQSVSERTRGAGAEKRLSCAQVQMRMTASSVRLAALPNAPAGVLKPRPTSLYQRLVLVATFLPPVVQMSSRTRGRRKIDR